MTAARVSEEHAELVVVMVPAARLSEQHVELVVQTLPPLRLSEMHVELVIGPPRNIPLRLTPRQDDAFGPLLPRFWDSDRGPMLPGTTYS